MISKNTFANGLSGDFDHNITPPDQYIDAHNVTLVGTGKFLSLENIQGTAEVDDLGIAGTILAVYGGSYLINSVSVNALTIFSLNGSTFKIWCYDLDNSNLYELFEETTAGNPEIDAVLYPESGIDILYFADNVSEIRKIRCEIPSPYAANFLTPQQISLLRRATLGTIELDEVTSGGSILTGSYQASLRLFNSDTRSYSKWTIPSHPVFVSRDATPNEGAYGMGSNKKIVFSVSIPTNELANWTNFQVAIFENTANPSLVDASLQKSELLTGGVVSGEYTVFTYEYKENTKIDTVQLSDIVVDTAAIQAVKTLQIKNNRLFAGNITYRSLQYDRGEPQVTGSISTQTAYTDTEVSKYKSAWREEVYRYYIAYFDQYYNFFRAKPLDLSSITGNLIATGDMKYPSRKTAGYTVLDGSSNPRSLGLDLTITNHPSDAYGFVVLRAKRKKRIKFQSPFIPSCLIEGIDAIGTYPEEVRFIDSNNDLQRKTLSAATPMNPVGTLMPKNFNHTVKKDIVRTQEDSFSTRTQKGECKYAGSSVSTKSNSLYFVYPPTVWGGEYNFERGDKYELTDIAFLRMTTTSFETNVNESSVGNFIQTSVHSSFYGSAIDDYYYGDSASRLDPALITLSGEIGSYTTLDNLSEGTSIEGLSLEQYENLQTGGLFYNIKPGTQKVGAVYLKTARSDSTIYGNSSYGSNQLSTNNGGTITNSLFEVTEAEQTNKFASSKGYTLGYASSVDIVNIVNDYGDDRYGESDSIHDCVFTGASHVFDATERAQVVLDGQVAVNLLVFGGDAFINFQQVKVTDNHYGLINAEKLGGGALLGERALVKRWDHTFLNKYDVSGGDEGFSVIAMPVPYKNVSQVLSVWVESEQRTSTVVPYPYDNIYTDTYPIITENNEDSKLRIPFTYGYNINYSKESDQKVVLPFSDDERITTRFPARIVFSNEKVYQTDIAGFDLFPVGNTQDLEETYRGLTKLTLSGDSLIALQEKAILYVPVDAAVISTTDAASLSVRSGVVVDTPNYISRQYGCSNIKSVIVTDDSTIFADKLNKVVIKLTGNQVNLINEKGMIGKLSYPSEIVSLYDPVRRHYWFSTDDNCWIWDDRLGLWTSNFEFGEQTIGTYKDRVLLLQDGKLWEMYGGAMNSLFGTTVVPRVSFSVNPEIDVPKTFDNLNIYSSSQLSTADLTVESDLGTQSVTGLDIDVDNREGNYRVAVLRDSNSARLRGIRMTATLKWKDVRTSLNQVITKFRPSARYL